MIPRLPLLRSAAPAAALLALAAPAFAHHPGSHAARRPDGRVLLEVAAQATDACTRVASVTPGAPGSLAPVPGTVAVTARLERQGSGPCATVVTAAKADAVLDLGRDARQILLYVVAPDGAVAATERVPIR